MGRLRIQYNAPVVLTFSLLSLAALLLGMATGEQSTWLLFCVYRSPLTDPLTYVRLFGHVLGHAGYGHFISNIMLLLVVGPPLEEKYGSRRLLVCIAITALVSGLVQVLLFPGAALLGASGIVVDAVAAQDSVSQLTHIVGGLCGAALGFAMSRFQPFSR